MRRFTAMVLIAGLVLGAGARAAPAALPDGASVAHLVVPVSQPVERLVDGRDWSCMGGVCTAGPQAAAESMPLWMECSDAAAEFGAFTDYRTGSSTLEPSKLVRCNAHATTPANR